MVKSVMNYLLDGVKAATDDLKALSTGSRWYDTIRGNSMMSQGYSPNMSSNHMTIRDYKSA